MMYSIEAKVLNDDAKGEKLTLDILCLIKSQTVCIASDSKDVL